MSRRLIISLFQKINYKNRINKKPFLNIKIISCLNFPHKFLKKSFRKNYRDISKIKMKGGKMKKILTFMFVFLLGLSFTSAITESEETIIKTNVFPTTVSISVPDEINFGNISAGYVSEKKSFYINNTGTTDVLITASLPTTYAGKIFNYLHLKKTSTGTWLNLETFNVTIDKPDVLGEFEDQIIYAEIDLSNLPEETQEINEIQTNLIFTAVSI